MSSRFHGIILIVLLVLAGAVWLFTDHIARAYMTVRIVTKYDISLTQAVEVAEMIDRAIESRLQSDSSQSDRLFADFLEKYSIALLASFQTLAEGECLLQEAKWGNRAGADLRVKTALWKRMSSRAASKIRNVSDTARQYLVSGNVGHDESAEIGAATSRLREFTDQFRNILDSIRDQGVPA